MAALVQSYPQQSGTVTMLQSRNGSGSTMLPTQAQASQQYGANQQQRNGYPGVPGAAGNPLVYRGTSTPIQPYAFTTTPNLHPNGQWHQSGAFRGSSSSAIPTMQTFDHNANDLTRSRHSSNSSMSNLPNPTIGITARGSRDDSALPAPGSRRVSPAPRPQSGYFSGSSIQLPPQVAPAKSSPDRYRRPAPRVAESSASGQGSAPPSGSGMVTVNHLYSPRPGPETIRRHSPSSQNRPNSFYATVPGSVDDMQLHRHQEEAKRFRRRSMPTLDSPDFIKPLTPHEEKRPDGLSSTEQAAAKSADKEQIKTARIVTINSTTRSGSSESLISSCSSNSRPSSSANRNNVSTPTGNPAQFSTVPDQNTSNPDYPKLVTIPPRSSSSDAAKRLANPSPLSKPVTMDAGAETSALPAPKSDATTAPAATPVVPATSPGSTYTSPAVKQLAAISQKGGKLKSKSSRLRRAFSFGSAAELKNATEASSSKKTDDTIPSTTTKLQKNPPSEEFDDAEQARIAEQQEAAGIGHNIYAGSRLFSGSNDNLSISSTASSASIMIRKMGRGMKKGGRNLVGLFRPKSIIGVPSTDSQAPEGSQAAVSMITVEAERAEGERVNVNPDVHTQPNGGTGFPHLERNSIDATNAAANLTPDRAGSSGTDNSNPRKSIIGGDKERAEVLAAVRKGILKHTNGPISQLPRPSESKSPAFELPAVPRVSESPISSGPSTPNDDNSAHKRSGSSVTIGNEDYFMTALRIRQDTQSAPSTPQGGGKRNATFSPRIVFYDTWPSQEYDRRGEIATCNRLTPMLAQQIKEELNTFKMEMEVHENSKIYTHFF